jgi:hypothetical protein
MLEPAALADNTTAVVIRETTLIAWGWRLGFANRPVDLFLWPRLMAVGLLDWPHQQFAGH